MRPEPAQTQSHRGLGRRPGPVPGAGGVLLSEGFPSSFRCVARSLEPTSSNLLDSVAQNGGCWGGTPESPCTGGLVRAQGARVPREMAGAQAGRKGTCERDRRAPVELAASTSCPRAPGLTESLPAGRSPVSLPSGP